MQHLCHLVFEIVTEKCEGQTDRRWSKKVNPKCLPYYAGRHKNVQELFYLTVVVVLAC